MQGLGCQELESLEQVYVKGVLEEGAAYGTSREGGLVECSKWQGTVVPCGLMASHSFSFFTASKDPSRHLTQQIWICKLLSAPYIFDN